MSCVTPLILTFALTEDRDTEYKVNTLETIRLDQSLDTATSDFLPCCPLPTTI